MVGSSGWQMGGGGGGGGVGGHRERPRETEEGRKRDGGYKG